MKPIYRAPLRASMLIATAFAVATSNNAIAAGSQKLLSLADDQGPVGAATSVEFKLWMKLHDQAGLDALVTAQQAGKAGFLTVDQVRAQHSATAADVAKATAFLKGRGFEIKSIGQGNAYVSATGTAAHVEDAFKVDLHQYAFHGRTFNASPRNATVPAELVPVVASVGGLSDMGAEPDFVRVSNKTMKPTVQRMADAEGMKAKPHLLSAGAGSDGLIYTAQCFYAPTTVDFSGSEATATYEGNRYGAPITNTSPGSIGPCGYQPSDVQTAYDLTALYKEGLTGAGTTIAIVDAYGSTTIAADIKAFSLLMGLPPADLTIIGKPTENNYSTDANAGWAGETTLDVEWVHSVAPGAKIVLVVAPTSSFDDLFAAVIKAASVPGVVSISNSYSGYDIGLTGDSEFYKPADNVLKQIGAAGISVNYSTGDYGNNAASLSGLYTSTGWPASSPYATGIGGVSAVLNSKKQIAWQTSWGTNLTEIADTVALGSPAIDPLNNEGFVFGGTGGESDVYDKPSWQTDVPGPRRQTPDISWLADPYTGVEIVYTADKTGDLGIEVIGGTSLSCPMFSALWGIATQAAHHKLGQAAPHLYRLPHGAITDVTTVTSQNNVKGVLKDSGGTNIVSSTELAAPLQNLPSFVSALYQSPYSTRWFVLTFGTDSTLTVGPGWDNSTGLGTPNPPEFVRALGEGW